MFREHETSIHRLQRLADIFWVVAAQAAALRIYGQRWTPEASTATLAAILIFVVAAEFCSLYRPWRVERLRVEARMVFLAWLATVSVLVTIGFASKVSHRYSRVATFGWFILTPVILCGWRAVVRTTLRMIRANGRNVRKAVILGATAQARDLCREFARHPWFGIKITGVFDDRSADRREDLSAEGCPFGGTSTTLLEACQARQVDTVYIALPMRAEPRIARLLDDLSNTTATVHFVADFMIFKMLSARWTPLGDLTLISVHDTPFLGLDRLIKRLEDILVGSVIVSLIAIPMLVIAVIIKLTSPGPVFFRQRRHGLNGEEIRVLKFRTMTVLEDGPVVVQAKRDDVRITKFGKFLRRTSLDELPQFLQVLTGQMSIVGPRPHAVAHNELYRSLISGYMLRHKVKPGITGWAQVNGWRGETPDVNWMKTRVDYDLAYIRRWTLLWDLKIIFLTIFGQKKSQNAF